jgi:hypothetical protein
MAKRYLETRASFAIDCVSSLLTGIYVAYTFSPGGVSAGFTAVPTPATFALIGELLGGHIAWRDARTNVISLAISVAIVTIVHLPFARAARRARERNRQFDERQRTAPLRAEHRRNSGNHDN